MLQEAELPERGAQGTVGSMVSWFGRGPSVFVGGKRKGIMSLILDLVLLGNSEMCKGKYRLDS